ncbi:hypothetical protein VPNG_07591 [Cytospora leucostoma]|uniref:Protein kinase domain-containing protein n=1 Tax=Cytospora leucostoma TaxID=1230097 RepID=A0A423WDF4_9PEZI|nr:hypothetical protein VPNG_07591 [Cytospora leucostoma]
MSAASPTPLGAGSHFTSLGRRTSARQALRRPTSRAQVSRSESQPVVHSSREVAQRALGAHSQPQQYDAMHDSSDDEIPVPMKLSALTKALLNDGGATDAAGAAGAAGAAPPQQQPESRIMTRRRSYLTRSSAASAVEEGEPALAPEPERPVRETRRHARSSSTAGRGTASRPVSPALPRDSSPPRKRVVRLSNTSGDALAPAARSRRSPSTSSARRPGSRAGRDHAELQGVNASAPAEEADVNTPAQSVRRVQIPIGSSVQRSSSQKRLSAGNSSGFASRSSGSAVGSDHEMAEEPQTAPRPPSAIGSVSRFGGSVMAREERSVQGSMRVKRLGKIPGSFLSGPARRGRRRESEEERMSIENGEGDVLANQERDGPQPYDSGHGDADPPASSYYEPAHRDFAASGSPISSRETRARSRSRQSHADLRATSLREAQKVIEAAHQEDARAPPELPSARDQENGMPAPSAFQRRKPSLSMFSEKDHDRKPPQSPSVVELGSRALPRAYSPERPILATISQNVQKTPHVVIPYQRPAPPPPPKMSVLDAATATAGAATTKEAAKKKSIILKVNGRSYQRVDCIGRGGSAKVYRVTAENGKMFALKRVNIENADENTVRGYKGEINLLQKLSSVERVIQLYDFELNEEKKVLSLLMEMGELDLNTLLRIRQNPEGSKLDPVFIRFYWKEMLECLAAVHTHDIVHSDLKPANFVVVQGRLKLIDFGIANAIQTDETVNVHRETQIGTPNYMSPESLMDSSQYAFTSANGGRYWQGARGPKLMKLGKPSDVWSLGCILYQMVYGTPPFGTIQNQMARCQAIINWNHRIDYPEKGLGGVKVPPSLLRTMKRCLDRDQHARPSCEQLLREDDGFLYPTEFASDIIDGECLPITEELLGRIIQSVVTRCRERLPTDGEIMKAWPSAYWVSVRKAIEAKQDGSGSGAR